MEKNKVKFSAYLKRLSENPKIIHLLLFFQHIIKINQQLKMNKIMKKYEIYIKQCIHLYIK